MLEAGADLLVGTVFSVHVPLQLYHVLCTWSCPRACAAVLNVEY
jgi:hypothetical protein